MVMLTVYQDARQKNQTGFLEREGLASSCPEPVSLEVALARKRESCGMIREEAGRGADSEEDALDGQAIIWSRETPDVEKIQQ